MATVANYPTFQPPSSAYQAPSNLGNNPQLHVEGYPKFAFFFSQCTRYLHLRRFTALAVRLLLYRQHQLTELEKTLLELEARDAHSNNPDRRLFCENFACLKATSSSNSSHVDNQRPVDEQQQVYEMLKIELKEYEEALIRFDRLGGKGYDMAQLRSIQRFLGRDIGDRLPLFGLDASTWGSDINPRDHASDLIQVVHQSTPSAMGQLFRDKLLLWAPRFPNWLWMLLFWSKKNPDTFRQYRFSSRAIEVVSLAIGNFMTSLLIYAAVTSLYLTAGRAASVVGVVVIAGIITICSVVFRNQQFISMLATVCAVLVTLLLKDGSR